MRLPLGPSRAGNGRRASSSPTGGASATNTSSKRLCGDARNAAFESYRSKRPVSAWVLQTVVFDFAVRLTASFDAAGPWSRPHQTPREPVAVTVGPVLNRRPAFRPTTAATALLTAFVVASVGGCGHGGGGTPSQADEPTVITSTTRVAGAAVLGNQRRPDDSCAADPTPV